MSAPFSADEFGAWASPHLTVLAAVAARQVGADAAADVVQEALLRAWRRRETFNAERGTPRAWLAAIVLDQARRHRRRHSLGRRHVPAPPAAPDSTDARLDIERAVAALPRRQQQVITLHYLADLAVADTAHALGISESAVKSHLTAARRTLRRALEGS